MRDFVEADRSFFEAMKTSTIAKVLFVAIAIFVRWRPYLFGVKSPRHLADDNLEIFKKSEDLDRFLAVYAKDIGADLIPYRNHCLRVLSFSVHHLKTTFGASKDFIRQNTELVAAILAYHDIALWTDEILDYLDPSWERFQRDFSEGGTWTVEQMNIAKEAILQHHKVTSWSSSAPDPNRRREEEMLVNAIRMGDWVDASFGVFTCGLAVGNIAAVFDAIPEEGFHRVGMGTRLSPDSLVGRLDPLKIFKW